eukprot:351243-Prymnesium_polylepis.1
MPQSDWDRGVEAFKKLWSKYWGEAKLWSAKAQRAISLSGVPAELAAAEGGAAISGRFARWR